jgi:hypothetical protein
MKKRYGIKLTRTERKKLMNLTRKGVQKARKLTRARILLHADESQPMVAPALS